MTKKFGVDTSEWDNASYKMAEDLTQRQILEALVPDQDYVEKIVDTVKKTVRCEDSLIRQILYTAASKNTVNPQNLGILCPTGEGKTHATTETLDCFSKQEFWSIGRMSPMVLVRNHSILIDAFTHEPIEGEIKAVKKQLRKERRKPKKEINDDLIIELEDKIQNLYDNSKRLIDLQGMLLVCLEPPHPETWKILKPILSHDNFEIEYPYVDKIEGVGTKTIKIVTRGWPACIFCSAKNESDWPEWPEIQSRFLISSTNMIQQKYVQGNQIIGQRYGLPKSVQQTVIVSDHDKEVARMCVRQLLNVLKDGKENNNQQVWIPYYEYLSKSLPAQKGTDNRLAGRIFALLSIITQCNTHLRYKIQVDDEILPIADINHDLAEVLNITHNITGIPTFKMQVFKEVVLPVYNSKERPDVDEHDPSKTERIKAVTTRQCCDKYKEIMKRTISTDAFKKTYLDEFLANGLMDDEESIINKSRRVYYPIIDVPFYSGNAKEKDQNEEGTSMTSNLSRFDLCLQQYRVLSPKNHIEIPRNWLELEILFILEHRIGEDNKAKEVSEELNGEFSLRNERNEEVCICKCINFLNTPSLIRYYHNATFVDNSQEMRDRTEYLYKIYPCSCKHRSNQSDFDVEDVKSDTTNENQNQDQKQKQEQNQVSEDDEMPPWVKENRMWTHEEAEKWKKEYEELSRKSVED